MTLPQSEIEDYSHLHSVLLEWKVICLKESEFHYKQRAFSLSSLGYLLQLHSILSLEVEVHSM